MEYVKMPELLSGEAARALISNTEAIKGIMDSREADGGCHGEAECCCPKKVKFIFVMNNVVIVNINAVCEEEKENHGHRPEKC